MAIAQVVAGARILISDLNAYYSLLKGSAGEAVTLIYNAAGSVIFQPSSDPAATTQLVQIKNNAGTVKSALTSGGGLLLSNPALFAQSSDLASSGTTDLSTATGNYAVVTGTTTITAFGTVQAGTVMVLKFSGALTLTHNATSLIMRSAANATTVAGDIYAFVSEGSGNWREIWHLISPTVTTNAVSGDVTITTAGTFYDGPTVTLGPGTWVLNGNVTVRDTAGSLFFTAKLWDGTTVYTSTEQPNISANAPIPLPLSWVITLTAASTTVKISVTSTGSTNGRILAAVPNSGAGNNASWLTAHRIA